MTNSKNNQSTLFNDSYIPSATSPAYVTLHKPGSKCRDCFTEIQPNTNAFILEPRVYVCMHCAPSSWKEKGSCYQIKRQRAIELKAKQTPEKPKTYKQPQFFELYTTGRPCKSCKEPIGHGPVFRWMINGTYEDYHADLMCFPTKHNKLFAMNEKFCKWYDAMKKSIKK